MRFCFPNRQDNVCIPTLVLVSSTHILPYTLLLSVHLDMWYVFCFDVFLCSYVKCETIVDFFFFACVIRLLTFHWLITLELRHPSTPHMFLTPPEGTPWSGSGRRSAPLLRGSPTLSWCTVETMARNSWLLGSSSMLWRLFICWLTRTPFRLLLKLLSTGMYGLSLDDDDDECPFIVNFRLTIWYSKIKQVLWKRDSESDICKIV